MTCPTWEVFYTPHTDDETIGMAGAIVDARTRGVNVLVVLVTDNAPSMRGTRLFPGYDAFMERRAEWKAALLCLDVTEMQTWEVPEQEMLHDPAGMQSLIYRKMQEVANSRDVVHHHTVWGVDDVHIEASLPTLSHVLCANAAKQFRALNPQSRVSLHAVYIYSHARAVRDAPTVRRLSTREWRLKNCAMACFKQSERFIGYGYASVPELFDEARDDPREYIQEID